MSTEIKEQLDRIERMLIAIVASFDAGKARPASTPSPSPTVDLDSEHGNFTVRKDPPRWKGRSFAGKRLSETEPEYLDTLAGFKDWCAEKDRAAGDEKKAGYAALDAARCRGWADRLRAGWRQPTLPGADSDVPF